MSHHITQSVMRGSPLQLAAALASAIEADPTVAALIKEHCPPKKLLRLLALDNYVDELLAEQAVADDKQLPLTKA